MSPCNKQPTMKTNPNHHLLVILLVYDVFEILGRYFSCNIFHKDIFVLAHLTVPILPSIRFGSVAYTMADLSSCVDMR